MNDTNKIFLVEEHLVHGHHVEGVFDNDDEFTTYFEMVLHKNWFLNNFTFFVATF